VRGYLMKGHKMTLEEAVVENLRDLPVDKQQEVLDFVQFLRQKAVAPRQRPQLRGLWADTHVTEEDIAEVRREMWANFPRDDV
jgi:hypothetical protein